MDRERSDDDVIKEAYRFDGLGKWSKKKWDLTEGSGSEFCWYHVVLPVRKPYEGLGHTAGKRHEVLPRRKLVSFRQILTKALCPPLKDQDINTMISGGPFCDHVDGAFFFRVNSSGPSLSEFNLRLAARVTEKSVITVSLGPIPRLGFSPSDQSSPSDIPENPNLVRSDKKVGQTEIVNEERDPESLLANNPMPKTVGNLLVHIVDRSMDHLQDIVTKIEMWLDIVEDLMKYRAIEMDPREIDGNDIYGRMRHHTILPAMHSDLQRLLQVIAHVEQVFPLIKEKCSATIEQLMWSKVGAEDMLPLDGVSGRLMRLKENVKLIVSRLKATQSGIDSTQAAEINRKLYYLSIVSVIFLPLSFITGVFGMSVGGMPWTGQEDGFRKVLLVCGLMLVVLLACCMFRVLYKCIKPRGFSLKQLGQRILWEINWRILVIVAYVWMCVVYGKQALQTHFSAGIEH